MLYRSGYLFLLWIIASVICVIGVSREMEMMTPLWIDTLFLLEAQDEGSSYIRIFSREMYILIF